MENAQTKISETAKAAPMENQNAINDIKKVEDNLISHLGSPILALSDLNDLLQSIAKSRATPPLSNALLRMEKKKDETAAKFTRFIVGKIWAGSKIKLNKDTGKYTVKIKGIEADQSVLDKLAKLVEEKRSIRSNALRSTFTTPTSPKEKTLEEKQSQGDNTLDRLAKDWGMDRKAVKALLSALKD